MYSTCLVPSAATFLMMHRVDSFVAYAQATQSKITRLVLLLQKR